MSRILLSTICCAVVLSCALKLQAEEIKPLKALLIAGGCCHDYAKQQEILSKGIMARAYVQVDVYWTDDKSTAPVMPLYDNDDWAKGYDVIIHDECSAGITDKAIVARILNAHKSIPAVNLHCAMHSYRTGTDDWFKFIGIQSSGHGPQEPVSITYVDRTHPITQGLEDWVTVKEELYNNIKVLDGQALARGKQSFDRKGTQVNDDYIVAWTNQSQGARSFSTTIGHNNDTVSDDRYLQLVIRGMLWSCDKLQPDYLKPYTGTNKVTFIESEKNKKPLKPEPEKKSSQLTKPVNVKVSASSIENGHPPYEAIDGDSNTRWCAVNGSYPQSLTFELPEAKVAKSLNIEWESQNVYQFKLEGSLDNKSWTGLVDASQNDKGGGRDFLITNTDKWKFFRITGLGSKGGGWCSIREVQLKGEQFDGLRVQAGAAPVDNFKVSGNTSPEMKQLTPENEAAILKDVKVAPGFDVSLYAAPPMVNYPVYVAAAPNGDLYVSSDGNGSLGRNPQRGRILRLRDTDHDGRADEVKVFAKDVDSPRGLVWDHDRLYLLHPPHISVYYDPDQNGEADASEILIKGIAFDFKDRPADHTTNGLSLGIDGWLYIAGGDFGFLKAVGTDGRELQHRGGGVIRFRPDGSGLELFSTGTRNILGTPISPLLDLFARDNTNDGGGWDVRFHHFTGLEDHGYPRLYMNFQSEIIKPLNDYGGGSGCGSVYLSEPGFPEEFNNAPLTCDWGTGALWKHTVKPHGATFVEEKFPTPLVKMTRPTDADVDGMSRLYQASWKGATFNWEGPDVGYIVCVKPTGYMPEPLPDFENLPDDELIKLLESPSQVRTLEAQRVLLRRPVNPAMIDKLISLVGDTTKALPARVAGLYALTQRGIHSENSAEVIKHVAPFMHDSSLQRFVLRALGDMGLDQFTQGNTTAPLEPFRQGLKSSEPRTRLEAIVSATRQHMLPVADEISQCLGDPDPVVAHTAFRALAMLNAHSGCIKIIDNPEAPMAQKQGALLALMRMHDPVVVNQLVDRIKSTPAGELREMMIGALCRLYYVEGPWKGESWGTRPDTRGPYYSPVTWSESEKIKETLQLIIQNCSASELQGIVFELNRNRIILNDAVDRIITQAQQEPAFLFDAVAQLVKLETLPDAAIPLMIKAADQDNVKPQLLSELIKPLAKLNQPEVVLVLLKAMVKIEKANLPNKKQTIDSYLQGAIINNQFPIFVEFSQINEPVSFWAKAAVLSVLAQGNASPEAKALATKVFATSWENPVQQMQWMKVASTINSHELDDQILTASTSTDPKISKQAQDAIKQLKIKPLPPDHTPKIGSMKTEEAIAAILKTQGQRELGERIFKKANCAACHTLTQSEVQKGPFLGTIAKTYKRLDLITNILLPNKTIAQGFATNVVVTDDGLSLSGFITLESNDKIMLRDNQAKEFTIPKDKILERSTSPVSMMPDNLVQNFTVQEMASLVDYLESLAK
jgi:putative membrane-bound dehydrogenase-like protein